MRSLLLWLAACAFLLLGPGLSDRALAFIDIKATPRTLLTQSQDIAVGTLAPDLQPERWLFTVTESLKGIPGKQFLLRLPAAADPATPTIARVLKAAGDQPAILFVGRDAKVALLHVGGEWLRLLPAGPGWQLDLGAKASSGTWAGGTDMLIRLARFLLADPKAITPTSAGVAWLRDRAVLGTAEGTIAGLCPVELGDPPRPHIFVACDKGDRLFCAQKKNEAFDEVTKPAQLATRSRRFVWVDLDGAGTRELVSWNGSAIQVRRFRQGAFQNAAPDFPLAGECLGLAACPTSPDGPLAVLVSTADQPFLLALQPNGHWTKTLLPGPIPPEAGAVTCACFVLDVDGDSELAILQPRAQRGLLWKATPRGFAPPVLSAVNCPDAPACGCVADFDGDGLPDLFLSGPKTNELWANQGHGKFTPALAVAGSLSYKSAPGASFCCPADLNHDGRADLCLGYPKSDFAFHFNRGFRCFGEEGELHLPGDDGIPLTEGQVAAAVWDFNGDGALDLVVAFADGQVACYYNAALNRPLLRLTLAPALPTLIPFSVWQGPKDAPALGAFLAEPGHPRIIPLREASDCRIRYTLPGRPPATLKVSWPTQPVPPTGLPVLLPPSTP